MNCLQENFEKPEFKKKHPNCYNEVKKFTEMESKVFSPNDITKNTP